MKNKRILTSGLACLVLGLVSKANATIVYTDTVSFGTSDTPYNNTVALNQFDPSTLTPGEYVDSITIISSATMSGNSSLFNGSTHAQSAVVTFGGNLQSYDGPDVNLLSESQPSETLFNGTILKGQTLNFTEPGLSASYSYSFTPTTTTDQFGDQLYASDGVTPVNGQYIIDEFLGTGTEDVNLTGDAVAGEAGGSGLTFTSTIAISGSVEIEYDVVPETGTWMSAGLLCGVVVVTTGRSLWRKGVKPVA